MKRLIIQQLLAWKKSSSRKPLLVKGVRQVGKTYILKEFGKKHFVQVHYVNFEKNPNLSDIFEKDLDPKRIINELSFFLKKQINVSEDFVIFDEIQACPKALTSLKYFQEDMESLALCAAGSLLGIYLGPLSFPVGKVDMLTLRPMCFEEFLMACNEKQSLEIFKNFSSNQEIPAIAHAHLWTFLKYYFITGGLPEAVKTFCEHKDKLYLAFTKVREKQDQLVIAYFADMAKHSGKVNAMHLDRVFKSVPQQLEKAHDQSSGRYRFGGVFPGVSHYQRFVHMIDWLENTGLVSKIPIVNQGILPFKGYAKENMFKLFLFDVGILGSMIGLSPETILNYEYGSYKGYFAENFVAQEFRASGTPELFSWSEKKSELEFLREVKGKVIPVEVKSGSITKAKSLEIFSKKYSPDYQVIFSGKPYRFRDRKNVYEYPLYLAGKFPFL